MKNSVYSIFQKLKTSNLKAIFFVFCFLLEVFPLFAQSQSFVYNGKSVVIDEKIVNHFGANSDYLQQLKTSNTDLLFYLNYYVKEAFVIENIHAKVNETEVKNIANVARSEKSLATQFVPTNHATFNILAFDIQLLDKQQVFKTGIGSEAIIVKSKKAFLEKYNTYRNSFLK